MIHSAPEINKLFRAMLIGETYFQGIDLFV